MRLPDVSREWSIQHKEAACLLLTEAARIIKLYQADPRTHNSQTQYTLLGICDALGLSRAWMEGPQP